MVFIHNGFWQNGSCCTRDCGGGEWSSFIMAFAFGKMALVVQEIVVVANGLHS